MDDDEKQKQGVGAVEEGVGGYVNVRVVGARVAFQNFKFGAGSYSVLQHIHPCCCCCVRACAWCMCMGVAPPPRWLPRLIRPLKLCKTPPPMPCPLSLPAFLDRVAPFIPLCLSPLVLP